MGSGYAVTKCARRAAHRIGGHLGGVAKALANRRYRRTSNAVTRHGDHEEADYRGKLWTGWDVI